MSQFVICKRCAIGGGEAIRGTMAKVVKSVFGCISGRKIGIMVFINFYFYLFLIQIEYHKFSVFFLMIPYIIKYVY